ncbi:MAG: ABC transporter substrate-binding protein [Planctomycetota bacterium]|jgi:iron complex transport system substrate-binding protein|nr:ABC transporter substrate-binding protein [Planctomycetota bacterium]
MSRISVLNAVLVVTALVLSVVGAWYGGAPPTAVAVHGARHDVVELADGRRAVLDSRGEAVPLADYQRILSVGLIADHVALELCEPERVVGFSTFSVGRDARRIGQRPRLEGLRSLEAALALKPDLVLLSGYPGDVSKIARLREQGIQVFDGGSAHGLATLRADIEAMGLLLGAGDEARRLADRTERRMRLCAVDLPKDYPRRRGVVLTTYGGLLFGGTRATNGIASSYHDVLVSAGIDDVIENRFDTPWPQVSAELIRSLAPDVIVTRIGMAPDLKRHSGLQNLELEIIEVSSGLLEHPGPPMADAADELFRLAYPDL